MLGTQGTLREGHHQGVGTHECEARMHEQVAHLDHRVFELQSLLKAGAALYSELDLESLYTMMIAMICERAGTDEVVVICHDEEQKQLVVEAKHGLEKEVVGLTFPARDGILWRLVVAGEPFSVMDRYGQPRFPEVFARYQLEMLGVLWVPMVITGRVIGVLALGPKRGGKMYREDEFRFLATLASQSAAAVSTARLYQSIAIARRDLDRSLHNLSMLFDVTRALGAISDLTRLLRLILSRAIDAVDAEKGSLMLLDEVSEELVIRVVFGLPDKEVEEKINSGEISCKRFRRGEGVAGKVLDTGQAIRVDDVRDERNFTQRSNSHVRSILCVPLRVDDDVIGVINITNRKTHEPFSQEDEQILEALSHQAAVAIARTRLYEAAITDSLTGLYVRRFIMHRLTEEVRRARRYGSSMVLIMADIDHFKAVNDTYGHPAGDAVITATAHVLRQSLRIHVDVIGRYGGEEFMMLLPQTDGEGGICAAERLRVAVEALEVEIGDGTKLKVTMSFGVTSLAQPAHEEKVSLVIQRADDALYRSKKGGRNCVSYEEPPEPSSNIAAPPCEEGANAAANAAANIAETNGVEESDSETNLSKENLDKEVTADVQEGSLGAEGKAGLPAQSEAGSALSL